MIKKILAVLGIILGIVILAVVGLIVFLSVTEYKPADREPVQYYSLGSDLPAAEDQLTIFTWNIGYAGLGKESDFFMDGGKMVDPPSQKAVEDNLAAIQAFIQSQEADAWLLQEIDIDSARTGRVDQFAAMQEIWTGACAFAHNYKCPFVPIPVPPIGKMEAGIATLTANLTTADAERISLPCPFSWPIRAAQLKRCLLVNRLPLKDTDKELVLVNLHLEAYDDGEGKIAQTNLLLQVLQEEYAKGNYVIAGGDFNQSFPDALEAYPITDAEKWTPGILEESILPEGWQFAYDISAATCRLLDQPYSEDCQKYVIDGFILSPNVQLTAVQTVDLDFENSDHNPVKLEIKLLQE